MWEEGLIFDKGTIRNHTVKLNTKSFAIFVLRGNVGGVLPAPPSHPVLKFNKNCQGRNNINSFVNISCHHSAIKTQMEALSDLSCVFMGW